MSLLYLILIPKTEIPEKRRSVDTLKLGCVAPMSRIGLWREPYEPEYRKIREFYGRPLRRGLDRKE